MHLCSIFNGVHMKKTTIYLTAILAICCIFYAGMRFEQYRIKSKAGHGVIAVTYDLFDQDDLLNMLISEDRDVNWNKAAVDSLLDIYVELNIPIHPDDYPQFMEASWNSFSKTSGETNADIDLFNTAMHRIQYLYPNWLYHQLSTPESQQQLKAIITNYHTWERTLIGLYSNNILLGSCVHRYYTFECASIAYDALENINMVLYWITNKQKGQNADIRWLEDHARWIQFDDYLARLNITPEKMHETDDIHHPLLYVPTFENEPDTLILSPEIGAHVLQQEETAWQKLSHSITEFANSYTWTEQWQTDLDEYLTIARYNALHKVATLSE